MDLFEVCIEWIFSTIVVTDEALPACGRRVRKVKLTFLSFARTGPRRHTSPNENRNPRRKIGTPTQGKG